MISHAKTFEPRAAVETRTQGMFAWMVHLWVEHYQRVAAFGIGMD